MGHELRPLRVNSWDVDQTKKVPAEYIFPPKDVFWLFFFLVVPITPMKVLMSISYLQSLAPDVVTSARWQHLYLGCFGSKISKD